MEILKKASKKRGQAVYRSCKKRIIYQIRSHASVYADPSNAPLGQIFLQ